jgi:hypothetical protein
VGCCEGERAADTLPGHGREVEQRGGIQERIDVSDRLETELARTSGVRFGDAHDVRQPCSADHILCRRWFFETSYQKLGLKEVDDGVWLVSFMHYDLGYIDLEQKTLQPLDNPFGPRLSPMSYTASTSE